MCGLQWTFSLNLRYLLSSINAVTLSQQYLLVLFCVSSYLQTMILFHTALPIRLTEQVYNTRCPIYIYLD